MSDTCIDVPLLQPTNAASSSSEFSSSPSAMFVGSKNDSCSAVSTALNTSDSESESWCKTRTPTLINGLQGRLAGLAILENYSVFGVSPGVWYDDGCTSSAPLRHRSEDSFSYSQDNDEPDLGYVADDEEDLPMRRVPAPSSLKRLRRPRPEPTCVWWMWVVSIFHALTEATHYRASRPAQVVLTMSDVAACLWEHLRVFSTEEKCLETDVHVRQNKHPSPACPQGKRSQYDILEQYGVFAASPGIWSQSS